MHVWRPPPENGASIDMYTGDGVHGDGSPGKSMSGRPPSDPSRGATPRAQSARMSWIGPNRPSGVLVDVAHRPSSGAGDHAMVIRPSGCCPSATGSKHIPGAN